jgi:hypothetical protein
LLSGTSATYAQTLPEVAEARSRHPWAQHSIGSWKEVRVVTETLDASGKVESSSTMETKTTLVAVDASSYRLKVDATVEIAGRRFQSNPKLLTLGFLGESPGQTYQGTVVSEEEVSISGRSIRCQVQEVLIRGGDSRFSVRTHYSADVAPHVLSRHTKVTDVGDAAKRSESIVEVLAVEMPYQVLSQMKPAAFVKTVNRKEGEGSVVTIEVQCLDVPGGVVAHSSQEFDANGRLVRRSTLELVDYEIAQVVQQNRRVTGRHRLLDHFFRRPRP